MTSENQPLSPTDFYARRFWWITLVLKLMLAATIPLFADEAYYWVWGQNPDWSYFDHPPMIGWWFALSDLLSLPASISRWPGVIFAHIGFWIWIRIVQENFPKAHLHPFLWLYALCPLTGLGGIAMTPDLPLALFWSASVWFALRFLRRPHWKSAVALGIALGLGFLSKYMIVLLPLSLAPLLFVKEARQRIFSMPLLLTILFGGLFCLPVFYWNWTHDWASFNFQLNHGLESQSFDPKTTLDYLMGVIVVLAPLWLALKRGFSWEPRALLVLLSGIGPFIFFLTTSFRAHVELNWPMMGLPALFVIACSVSRLKLARIYYGILTTVLVLVLFVPVPGVPVEKVLESRKYQPAISVVHEFKPLYASSYQMASALWYLSGEPVYKLRGSRRFDMYDMWNGSLPSTEKFYFLRDPDDRWPADMSSWSAEMIGGHGEFELWEIKRK